MFVFRIVKLEKRTKDLSGIGAYMEGGRWDNEGVFALYTSESEALAMLEIMVHVQEGELPPHLFIMTIELDDKAPLHAVSDSTLPANWRIPDNFILKEIGDNIFKENKVLGIKVRSAVMQNSYNYVLNPQFPEYYNLVRVIEVRALEVDSRL